jgi:putative endonuclease
MSYITYILYSPKLDKYYTGSCENIAIRINQHNTGRNTSTKPGIPWELKYTETYNTRSEAQSREAEIKKKKSRKYIEWLINSIG